MSRKSWLLIIMLFFLFSFTGCYDSSDHEVILRRPTGLSCTIPTYGVGATINWNAVDGADGYSVFIDGKEVGDTVNNYFYFSYEESDLYVGKSCVIQAYNESGGISLMSNALVIPQKAPISVEQKEFKFDVSKQNDNSLLIEWEDVQAIKYEIYIGGTKFSETKELSYLLTAEEVFANNNKKIEIYVIEDNIKIDYIPTSYNIVAHINIDAPIINSMNDEEGNFIVSWKKVEGAKSYNIYVDGSQYATDISELEFSFRDAPDYTGKNISVKAVDIYGRTSLFSNSCVYKNTLKKPIITATNKEDGSLFVTWDAVKYADSYTVYWRNPAITSEFEIFGVSENNITFKYDKYIANNEAYEIYVVASNKHGIRSASSNIIKYQVELAKPVIYTSSQTAIYTILSWTIVENAVAYEVYFDGSLYKTVTGYSCEISNSLLSYDTPKEVYIIAISSQGLKSEPSNVYFIKK